MSGIKDLHGGRKPLGGGRGPGRPVVVLETGTPEDVEALVKQAQSTLDEAVHLNNVAIAKIDKLQRGADGKSAYELYLEKGGELSLEGWLASLHGQDGQDADIAAAEAATTAANEGAAAANAATDAAIAAEATRQQTFETNEASRQTAAQNAEANRNGAYEDAEDDRDEAFATSESQRAATFTQNESGRSASVTAAQAAATAAATSAESANQKFTAIQEAISGLDPSQSTSDAVAAEAVTRAAADAQMAADIAALGSKISQVTGGYVVTDAVVSLPKRYINGGNSTITDVSSVSGTWPFELKGYKVSKNQVAKINIPKTTGTGKILAFSVLLPANGVVVSSYVDGITANAPLVDYSYTCPDEGYLCVVYNTTEAEPTVELELPDKIEEYGERLDDLEVELLPETNISVSSSKDAYVRDDRQKYIETVSPYGCKFFVIEEGKTYRYYIQDTNGSTSIPVSFFTSLPSNNAIVHSRIAGTGSSGVEASGTFVAAISGYVCLCGNKSKSFSLSLVKGTLDQRFDAIKQVVNETKANAVSKAELYAEGAVAYSLPDELAGTTRYTGFNNLGLIHRAASRETFNRITCCICRPNAQSTGTFTIYKSSTTPNKNTGEVVYSVENFSSDNFAPQNGLFVIDLGKDVTLENGEYLFTCFSGDCALYVYESSERGDGTTREGFLFQGEANTYRYSSSMTLEQKKGDIVELWAAINGEDTESKVRINLPKDLYCIKGHPQWFYYNTFIFGKESAYGNNLDNYHIEASASTTSIGIAKEDGFCVDCNTVGNYTLTLRVYDINMVLLETFTTTIHVAEAKSISGANVLMLGDSWTDPSIPIGAGAPAKGYTAETDAALKENGLTLNFVGSIDCGVSGISLKNEGRGGYAWDTYSKAPTSVRFKFFVATMPNISVGDVYTNNGSSYTCFEKGDGYITMTRSSGSYIPSGSTLTKSSGSGDSSITFTSYAQTTGNPFWNPTTSKVDFSYWRSLIGLEEELDFVTIQLGVNDSLGSAKTTKGQWAANLNGAETIIDAILEDSPNCKVIVNFVGMDAPSNTAWSSLNGLSSSKGNYQTNVYYLRKFINEMIEEREDYKTSVFIGQSVLGMNRWMGYEYLDRRDVYFKVNPQTLDSTILNGLRNKTYTYFRANTVYLRLYGYDERGYAILRPFLGTQWATRDQEFVGSRSDFDFSTIPSSGNLVLDGNTSVQVPYTEVKIENDNLKMHYFQNATHPYARGYREMARTLAAQIATI